MSLSPTLRWFVVVSAIGLLGQVGTKRLDAQQGSTAASAGSKRPVELGDIGWLRRLDQGLQQAKKENKPVLLLFQEVPG